MSWKYRSNMNPEPHEWKVAKAAMEGKLIDERVTNRNLEKDRNTWRREIYKWFGEGKRKSKNIINNLRRAAQVVKKKLKEKYDRKMLHLKKKYRKDEREKLKEIPERLEGLEELSVFNNENMR